MAKYTVVGHHAVWLWVRIHMEPHIYTLNKKEKKKEVQDSRYKNQIIYLSIFGISSCLLPYIQIAQYYNTKINHT